MYLVNEDTVAIPKAEYDRLMDVDKFMDALDYAGVDNWQGYDMAYEYYNSDGEVDW